MKYQSFFFIKIENNDIRTFLLQTSRPLNVLLNIEIAIPYIFLLASFKVWETFFFALKKSLLAAAFKWIKGAGR